jgi:hypothetical protein
LLPLVLGCQAFSSQGASGRKDKPAREQRRFSHAAVNRSKLSPARGLHVGAPPRTCAPMCTAEGWPAHKALAYSGKCQRHESWLTHTHTQTVPTWDSLSCSDDPGCLCMQPSQCAVRGQHPQPPWCRQRGGRVRTRRRAGANERHGQKATVSN